MDDGKDKYLQTVDLKILVGNFRLREFYLKIYINYIALHIYLFNIYLTYEPCKNCPKHTITIH